MTSHNPQKADISTYIWSLANVKELYNHRRTQDFTMEGVYVVGAGPEA